MSCDVLRRLEQEGAITIAELMDLWNLADSSVYPYLSHREMSSGKLRTLFRFAQDDRVRTALLAYLLPGTGFIAQRVDAELDHDGDGDVDLDDALGVAIEGMATAANAVQRLNVQRGEGRMPNAEVCSSMLGMFSDLIGQAMLARNTVEFIDRTRPIRHKLTKQPIGLGGAH